MHDFGQTLAIVFLSTARETTGTGETGWNKLIEG